MIKIYPFLYKTDYEKPFFFNNYKTNAYLLLNEDGNTMLYNYSKLSNYEEEINKLGGIKRHYLSHHHEGNQNAKYLFDTYNCKTTISMKETNLYKNLKYTDWIEEHRELDEDVNNFKIIYTPGHTIGSHSFLWIKNGLKMLFTGDSFILDEKAILTVPIPYVENPKQLIESLEVMKKIKVPLNVFPSGSFAKVQYIEINNQYEWEKQIELSQNLLSKSH